MTRRWLQHRLPSAADCRRRLGLVPANPGVLANTLSERLGHWLVALFDDPVLWHLNRRSVAGAVAVGLFVGWLPLPGQMLVAAMLAALVRVHVPLSVVMVWFTNPLTVAPLVSRPRELPPQPLAEPGVNLAAHRAPIVPTVNAPRWFQ